MKRPKISVVVVYNNVQENICETISSILNQTFTDIELVCVNNASTDESEAKILELTKEDNRVICLKLPNIVSYEEAVARGVNISSGEYVCVYSDKKILEENELEEKYIETIKSEAQQIILSTETLYKRAFIDNKTCLKEVINSCIAENNIIVNEKILSLEKTLYSEIDKCEKNNAENLVNNNYGVISRCNALEKLLYSYEERIKAYENGMNDIFLKYKEDVNLSVKAISDYVNSISNEKGKQISEIYEDITKNYKYTEDVVQSLKEELYKNIENNYSDILSVLEKEKNEIELKNEVLRNYVETSVNVVSNNIDFIKQESQVNDGINIVQGVNIVDLEVKMNKYFEDIYKHINENNLKFYKELAQMYREINEKLIK